MRESFERDGAVLVRGVVDPADCSSIHRAIERCRLTPSQHYAMLSRRGLPPVDSDLFRWFDDADIERLLFHSPLARLAGELLGAAPVVLVEDQWFASAPGASTPSPWHQDGPYYNIDGDFVTLWLALDDAPEDTALRVIPGSHRWGKTYAPVEFSAGGATIGGASGLEQIPSEATSREASLGWDVRAGDVVALHRLTLHSAGAESIPHRWFRRLSTRWASPAARYVDRGEQAAMFWRLLDHGLRDGDPLACATFPTVPFDLTRPLEG